mmetsp:Transcript_6818/g.10688  ORF Transcript_6818/g.10688 Transcript_6818/m.10688 type:complete len:245 (-) Transcript_6818:682-1416(-)
MFVLSLLKDTVRIAPENFSIDTTQAIFEELTKKYSNKIVNNLGLCISVYDLVSVGDPYLYPNDGASHTKVEFRMVVFKPFQEEVIVGRIAECDTKGVVVTLGFFDDIFIPASLLQPPSDFDSGENLWVWKFEGNDLYMDLDEEIRFRVKAIEYTVPPVAAPQPALAPTQAAFVPGKPPPSGVKPGLPPKPGAPPAAPAAASTSATPATHTSVAINLTPPPQHPPMKIIASINEDGLGLISWWSS